MDVVIRPSYGVADKDMMRLTNYKRTLLLPMICIIFPPCDHRQLLWPDADNSAQWPSWHGVTLPPSPSPSPSPSSPPSASLPLPPSTSPSSFSSWWKTALGLHNWQEVTRPCTGRSQVNQARMTVNMMSMFFFSNRKHSFWYLILDVKFAFKTSQSDVSQVCQVDRWPWCPLDDNPCPRMCGSLWLRPLPPLDWCCHNKYPGEAISDQGIQKSRHGTGW